MTIATKNGSIIVKDGKLAENCGCCGGWYCCRVSQCVSDGIESVTASISASDWSYQLTLSSSCGTKYASAYFKGSSASATKALTYDGSTAWTAIVTECDCYIAIRYVPYFRRVTNIGNIGSVFTTVARLEVRAVPKGSVNDSELKQSQDISCQSAPSRASSLSPNAAIADEIHSDCVDRLSALTATYNIQPPSMSVSSDCTSLVTSVSQSGSPVVTVTITPSYL